MAASAPGDPQGTVPAGLPHESGGYTTAARWLTELAGRHISRQCVWTWWHRRDKTGFPAGHLVTAKHSTRQHHEFYRAEVTQWWEAYRDVVRGSFWHAGLQLRARLVL